MVPMSPLELSKQTGTAVRGKLSAEERMPPTPRDRSMFIFRTVAGSRGTSAMRYAQLGICPSETESSDVRRIVSADEDVQEEVEQSDGRR